MSPLNYYCFTLNFWWRRITSRRFWCESEELRATTTETIKNEWLKFSKKNSPSYARAFGLFCLVHIFAAFKHWRKQSTLLFTHLFCLQTKGTTAVAIKLVRCWAMTELNFWSKNCYPWIMAKIFPSLQIK